MKSNEKSLTIIYPSDPYGNKVGGVENWIKDFIMYTPYNIKLKYIGISSDLKKRPPMRFSTLKIGNKQFEFLPLFYVKDENKKTIIPISLKFTYFLNKINNNFDNDLLFFHRFEPAFVFRNRTNKKLVIIHNDIEKQIYGKKSEVIWSKIPFIYRWFEKINFPMFDTIYSPSSSTIKYYSYIYPKLKEKFIFLSTFYSKQNFYPINSIKKDLKINLINFNNFQSKKWMLFVGRLQKQKSPLKLIETLNEGLKQIKDLALIIIGEGDLKRDMEELVNKYNLQNNVFFAGYKNQNEILNFYHASDLLILTSEFEGMPLCMLEALASGLPILSTPAGETIRIIKNGYNGELSDDFQVKNITFKLIKILKNYEDYSEKNCIESVKDYTAENVLQDIYKKIISLMN